MRSQVGIVGAGPAGLPAGPPHAGAADPTVVDVYLGTEVNA